MSMKESSSSARMTHCSGSCYEVVVVEVEGAERVFHSGSGQIINNLTKEEAHNGVLVLTCPDNA
jgi:hypothetical protein